MPFWVAACARLPSKVIGGNELYLFHGPQNILTWHELTKLWKKKVCVYSRKIDLSFFGGLREITHLYVLHSEPVLFSSTHFLL